MEINWARFTCACGTVQENELKSRMTFSLDDNQEKNWYTALVYPQTSKKQV